LLEWNTDKLHDLVSLGPLPVVVVTGVVIVIVPLALVAFALRYRRADHQR
jgi:hypothetical protein